MSSISLVGEEGGVEPLLVGKIWRALPVRPRGDNFTSVGFGRGACVYKGCVGVVRVGRGVSVLGVASVLLFVVTSATPVSA